MIVKEYTELEQKALVMKRSLTSRPLDLLYFTFFLSHIPASLLLDFQALYPSSLLPGFISSLPRLYFQMSNDPLIGGAMGYLSNSKELGWLKSFMILELVFQFPVFFLGLQGLWNDSRSIYPLLLIYAASTTTTTLPCLSLIFATPLTSPSTIAKGIVSITTAQRYLLLSSYIPFFLVPLLMTLDMAIRVAKLVRLGIKSEDEAKRK
ncbi:hypothetical protein PILCRDRAFT_812299 [Piloderma croceum F 1598]|uniref:EXPERA domain-containing protein n=1 Tax=Piloderma croceum (strain F 1598) TaxID=765440 RepID=A0A0C3GIS0_PILCF|nr:hypothetical protein PILCRDRAFT_812299 [Piloderma croceum F 1598]